MHTRKYLERIMLSLLKKKTINKIRVNEVIQELGVCKGTFYKYYGDKYELLVESFKSKFYDEICLTANDWEAFVLLCLEAFKKNSGIVLNAFDSNDVNSVRHYHESLISDYITKAVDEAKNLNEVSIYSIKICSYSYTEIMLDWLRHGAQDNENDLLAKMKQDMPYSIYRCLYM